jgi:3,4-dihydroxy 2-butanone 4-phosphate synthase / GTP cyclohydrolase II
MMAGDINQAVVDIEAGKMVIVVDETEHSASGDLIMGAQFADAKSVNYMMTKARAMLCVAMTSERLDELALPLMAVGYGGREPAEQQRPGPAFAVSVDAAEGIGSGDTAAGRAHTIQLLIAEDTRPEDLVRPGHVFPIRAREGGTLARVGHTEAAVDLARLAGLHPAGVLCHILNEDGTAAGMEALQQLAEAEGLEIVTIADIIRLRRRTERLIHREASAHLPTHYGDFESIIYRSEIDGAVYFAVIKGDLQSREAPLVRVHSGCVTGDVLGSLKCDCGWQLHAALRAIEEEGCGVVIYVPSQEGRGIGLANKIRAYHLQDNGYDTVEANEALGFPADMRDYGLGAQVLADLGISKMRLMTNNPAKYAAMDGYGLQVVERVPLQAPVTSYTAEYLRTKKDKMGHLLEDEELGARSEEPAEE